MRQTSDNFMDELLKDNTPRENPAASLSDKLAEEIDSRIDKAVAAAMSKYQAVMETIVDPIPAAEAQVPEGKAHAEERPYIDEGHPDLQNTIENK